MDHDHSSAGVDPRVAAAANAGCEESRRLISRRHLMQISAGLYTWAFMPKFAEAGTSNDPRLLIVVLRGGMDGLSVCVPFGDPHYVDLRGSIAIPKASTIQIDNFFGLHPALPNFGKFFAAKEAAVVHATCVPRRNRSHFDAQDNLENGFPDVTSVNLSGWLNRLLTSLPAGNPVRAGGAVEIGETPLILRGPAPVLGWSPTWFANADWETQYNIMSVYDETDKELGKVLDRGIKTDALAEKLDPNGVAENVSSLQKAFRGAARLMSGAKGPRIAVLSVYGWDTHVNQGTETGLLATALGDLDLGLGDFKTEIGKGWDNTVVACVTEFGRTAHINGDRGTDHGVGTVALLAGGAVNGGKVFGKWPGLATNALYEGSDLTPTTDLRAVFKGILADHIGVGAKALGETIFPGSLKVAPFKNLIRDAKKASQDIQAEAAAAPVSAPPPSAIARYRTGQLAPTVAS